MFPRTTYRVVLWVMALWFVGLGDRPAESQGRPAKVDPMAPLLPAEQAWLVTLPAAPRAGGALDGERVYVAVGAPESQDATRPAGRVVALDRETGATRWTHDLETRWPPAAADGVVVIAASDGIHALDAATGEPRWRAALPGPVSAPLGVAGGRLIVPVEPDGLAAFNMADGSLAWQRSFGGPAGPAAVAVSGGDVYLSLPGSRLVRASAADGRVVWERTLAGVLGPPALGRDRVLVGSTNKLLYALDPDDGNLEWSYMTGGDVIGAAAWDNSIYFVSLDNILRALNRGSGNQRWRQPLATRPSAPPRAFGGIVVVHGLSPALSAFAAKDGAPIGTFDAPPPSELIGPALIDEDLKAFRVAIVAITGDGRAIGLRPAGMLFREAPPVPLTVLPGRALPREPAP